MADPMGEAVKRIKASLRLNFYRRLLLQFRADAGLLASRAE